MTRVRGNVHRLGAVGIGLDEIVDCARFILFFVFGGNVAWCREISGVPERVGKFETFEFIFLFLREVLVCGAGVGEVRVAGLILGENVSKKKRVRRAPRIE